MKHLRIITFLLCAFTFLSASNIQHPAVGEQAPDIVLPNVAGDTLRLSDLRGKFVLVNFWASWCNSCRLENQHYKKLYKRYKDSSFSAGEGFDIFSVSMDHDLHQWKWAIINSKINWTNHVSDGLGWKSPLAEQFDFKYLPMNLLLDKDGVVIGRNVYKHRLNAFIKERLASQ